MAPLWFSSYVLQLRVPDVSLTVENIADFISAYIIGNLLQMGVPVLGVPALGVPRRVRPQPGQGARVHASPAGGIAEAMEDAHEAHEDVQRHPAAAHAAPSAPAGRPAVGLLAAEGVEDFVIQQRVDALHLRNVVELQRIL